MKRTLLVTIILFFVYPVIVLGRVTPTSFFTNQFSTFLTKRFPSSYKVVGKVSERHGSRLVFPKGNHELRRGDELLALKYEKNVPLYLLHQASVIRIEAIMGNKILAQEMAVIERPAKVGDPIVIPSSPVVYLYTNIKRKEVFKPYTQLIKMLLAKNFEVVELGKPELKPKTDRYGILIKLEGESGYLALRVQSIYSGDTLYFDSTSYAGPIATAAPSGVTIVLPDWSSLRIARYAQTFASQEAIGTTPKPLPEPGKQTTPKATKSFLRVGEIPETNQYRLNEKFKRMVIAEIDGDRKPDFVFLNDDFLEVYNFENGVFQKTRRYELSGGPYVALHLHAMDITGDGQDELFLTLGRQIMLDDYHDTILRSMILTFKNGAFEVLDEDLPYYLRVIEDRQGNLVALAQNKGNKSLYDGDIIRIKWNNALGKIIETGEYAPAHDVYSIYQFNLIPDDIDRIVILEPTNDLQVYYTPTEEPEVISDKNFGFYDEIPFLISPREEKFIGGFNKKLSETAYAPRRFVLKREYDDQMFLIRKGRTRVSVSTSLGNVLKTSQGEDSLVAVKWLKGQILETWQSESLSKDIIDFGFVKIGQEDKIVLLVRDKQGYAIEIIK